MRVPETLMDVLGAPGDRRTAIIVPEVGLRVSYESLRQQVLEMADALAFAGIQRGQRVAMALPNGLRSIVCFLAASIAGTAAPMNPAYPYEEFAYFLEDTGAHALICPPTGAEVACAAATDKGIPVLRVEITPEGWVRLHDAPRERPVAGPTADDIALILHTSGSTGRPKRVPLRHRNLVVSARNIAREYGLRRNDISLCIMPLFHIHGLVASTLAPLCSGGTVVAPVKFNPLNFWRTVRECGVTWYSAVPTMHQMLLARVRKGHHQAGDHASLRFIRSASAPLAPEVIHQMEETFGVPFVEAYGMTEASHQMSSNPLPPRKRKPGSVGHPTGIRVSILDEKGEHLDRERRGEVVIQGPSVFSGYENNPQANAAAFRDGWFRTGDQGYLDKEGYLHLTGRIKDLIIRGGENIAPREVDELLMKHPAVAEAVTFSVPHPTLGEEVAAAVVLHEPGSVHEPQLLKFCREKMAEFKCPKKIYIVKSIPLTATGKIRRQAVAAALLGGAS